MPLCRAQVSLSLSISGPRMPHPAFRGYPSRAKKLRQPNRPLLLACTTFRGIPVRYPRTESIEPLGPIFLVPIFLSPSVVNGWLHNNAAAYVLRYQVLTSVESRANPSARDVASCATRKNKHAPLRTKKKKSRLKNRCRRRAGCVVSRGRLCPCPSGRVSRHHWPFSPLALCLYTSNLLYKEVKKKN